MLWFNKRQNGNSPFGFLKGFFGGTPVATSVGLQCLSLTTSLQDKVILANSYANTVSLVTSLQDRVVVSTTPC